MISKNGGHGGGLSEPHEPKLDPPLHKCTCMLMHRHSGCIIHEHATRMYFTNIWAELSYECGPSCLINMGRVGMGRVFCGPSWHGLKLVAAELTVILRDSVRLSSHPFSKVGYESHDRAALPLRNLPRQEYIFLARLSLKTGCSIG